MTKLFRVVDEASWLSCTVPRHMLRFLKERTSDRKLRLWACAFCAHWYVANEEVTAAIAIAEEWADGCHREVDLVTYIIPYREYYVCFESAWIAAYDGAVRTLEKRPTSEKKQQAVQFQLATLHDVFGNPFRSVSAEPTWLTSDVRALARGIYDEKAFDRMPILADALQDAGCNNDEVLAHCRDANQVHVRGCWVVDLVLGKS
jgi:hypothetical protein